MNTWRILLRNLKSKGYEGADDDLAAIKAFVEEHNLGPTQNGKALDIDKIHAEAYPKKADLDLTEETKAADQEDRLVSALTKVMAGITPPKTDRDSSAEVKHVKERVEDDPKGGFSHLGEFYRDVAMFGKGFSSGTSVMSEKLKAWSGVTKAALGTFGSELSGADGGFAVPPEHKLQIEILIQGEESILPRTDQTVVSRATMTFPDDETTPWQTTGGIQASWTGESGVKAQSKPVLMEKTLTLRKLAVLVPMTDELLEDSVAMGSYVTEKAGQKLDFKIGEGIFRGTGSGQPLGFLNSSSLITVAKETSQLADTVLAANIIKMYSRMYGPYRRNAVWFINQDIEPQLFTMSVMGKKAAGTAASTFGGLVYMPANGMSSSPYGTLFGRPVIPTEHCETLGDVGDIVFAAMKEYRTLVKAGGLQTASSIHLWFDQDVTAFRFVFRMDGQTKLSAAISPRDGTNTMSAFVTLAARA